jgi:hypothetical protein
MRTKQRTREEQLNLADKAQPYMTWQLLILHHAASPPHRRQRSLECPIRKGTFSELETLGALKDRRRSLWLAPSLPATLSRHIKGPLTYASSSHFKGPPTKLLHPTTAPRRLDATTSSEALLSLLISHLRTRYLACPPRTDEHGVSHPAVRSARAAHCTAPATPYSIEWQQNLRQEYPA